MYKPREPKAKAGMRVRIQKAADVGVRVPLLLIAALWAPPASSSLLVRRKLLRKLRQMRGLAICLAGLVSKIFVTFVFSKRVG